MRINDIELEFELFDADTLEAYEAGFQAVGEKTEGLDWGNGADALRTSCEAVRDCFDSIFGEGIGTRVCGERPNFLKHMDAFEVLVDEAVKQRAELDARAGKTMKKYGGNREQRRAEKK